MKENLKQIIKYLSEKKGKEVLLGMKNRMKEDFKIIWCGMLKTPEEQELMLREIGDTYRLCKARMKLHDSLEWGGINDEIYKDDRELVMVVDLSVENCSDENALIIRKEFLTDSGKNWFTEYLSRSQYYRCKKKAVKEFFDNLIIKK
jgi:hypothetical protein